MMFNNEQYIEGLVSIIIPTHNRGDLIGETVLSAINQYYLNIEILIVDDNSSDNTFDVVNRLITENPNTNIKYFKNIQKGACAARNLGLQKSQGEYIQFFDSDDIIGKELFVKKIELLSCHPECDFVACNFAYFYNTLDNIQGYKNISNINHDIYNHLLNTAFPTPCFLMRRKAIKKMGLWDINCLRYQDIRYFHRIFLYHLKGIWLEDFLFLVRIHSNNISNSYDKKTLSSIVNSLSEIEREWSENKNIQNRRLNKIIVYLKLRTLFSCYNKKELFSILNLGCNIFRTNLIGSSYFIYYLIKRMFFKSILKKYSVSDHYLNF